MIIAIIHGRGGSKRIPRKNIKPFHGKPMIAYPLEVAAASGLFDRIIVSTDDEEIAAIGRDYGAETPYLRPEAMADDRIGTAEVLAWDLAELGAESVDYVCCIYATAPFITADALTRGLETMRQYGCSTAVPVTTFPFPIFRALKTTDDGTLGMFWPEHRLTRSQDLPEALHDAGQFYWVKPAIFLHQKNLYAEDTRPIPLARHLVQDLDTLEDWQRAEYMYKALKESGAL